MHMLKMDQSEAMKNAYANVRSKVASFTFLNMRMQVFLDPLFLSLGLTLIGSAEEKV